jgi:hypothetical protein
MISCTISPQSPPVAPLSKYPTAARISALASSELANSQGHLTGLGESPVTTPRTHQGLEPLKNQMKPFASSRRTSPCWRIAISSSSASLPSIHSAWRRRALMACFESASGLIRPVPNIHNGFSALVGVPRAFGCLSVIWASVILYRSTLLPTTKR